MESETRQAEPIGFFDQFVRMARAFEKGKVALATRAKCKRTYRSTAKLDIAPSLMIKKILPKIT
jgi:hypothetical protein